MRSVFAQTIVWRGRRGNWGESELVWSNQRFSHPSLHPVGPVLQHARPTILCNMLEERSQMILQLVSLIDLPHTYSCTYFYSTKQRWKQARTLPVVNTGESKLLLNKYLKSLILFHFNLLFMFFYHGKLGVMGNLAGWKHNMRMHELRDYIPERTYLAWMIMQ